MLPPVSIDILKGSFFDSEAVMRRVSAARRKVLSKQGAYVRRTAKGLIRKSKNTSRPGQPPRSHTGNLRGNIYFAYDSTDDTVVVGPTALNMTYFMGSGQPVTGAVPGVLERGGSIRQLEWFRPGTGPGSGWQRADLRRVRNRGWRTRMRQVDIAARPYMGPALEINRSKLAHMWANQVK